MEPMAFWLSVLVPVVFTFVGWIFNTLITRRIDSIEAKQKEDKELFFKQINGLRESIENDYVLQKLYDQAQILNERNNDDKWKSMLAIINTQFQNVENKIEGIKDFINNKFNDNKNQHQ